MNKRIVLKLSHQDMSKNLKRGCTYSFNIETENEDYSWENFLNTYGHISLANLLRGGIEEADEEEIVSTKEPGTDLSFRGYRSNRDVRWRTLKDIDFTKIDVPNLAIYVDGYLRIKQKDFTEDVVKNIIPRWADYEVSLTMYHYDEFLVHLRSPKRGELNSE